MVICLVVSATDAAWGQQARRVGLGEWVRLSTRDPARDPDWVVGALASSTDMYLVVEPITAGPLAIPHRSLTRVEVQRGWSSRTRPGGIAGAIAGLAASAAVGILTDCLPACVILGTPLGAGVGSVIGARHVRMRWESISPMLVRPNTQALAVPAVGLTIALAF